MKVNDLTGNLLNAWVAVCTDPRDWVVERREWGIWLFNEMDCEEYGVPVWGPLPVERETIIRIWHPTLSWLQGGPIIDKDQISLQAPSNEHVHGCSNTGGHRYDHWRATVSARTRTWLKSGDDPAKLMGCPVGRGSGETPLIAAMRAKVASHHGDEVPDDLPTAEQLA
jgi:hypothetical protein